MSPKYIIILCGVVCLAAGITTTVLVRNKLHKAKEKIAVLEDRNATLEQQKQAALSLVDSLMIEHVVHKEIAARQTHFADSMLIELGKFQRKIVLIHDTNDGIVGSIDIDGQMRAFTEWLNLAAQDSIQ